MARNHPAFLSELEKTDPKFHAAVAALFDLAMAPGELDARTKVLAPVLRARFVGFISLPHRFFSLLASSAAR